MRKVLIAILFALLVVFTAMAYACSNNANLVAEFKTNVKEKIYVGKELDLEKLIVRRENTDIKIEVTYESVLDGVLSETFNGYDTIFYPKYAVEHTLKYTVSQNGRSVSKTTKFTAHYPEPKLSVTYNGYKINLNRKTPHYELSFFTLISSVAVVTTPANVMPSIVSADRAEYDSFKEYEEHDFNEKVYLVPGALTYDFTEAGLYRFKAEYTNEGGTASAYIYVVVEKGEASKIYKSTIAEDGTVTIKPGVCKKVGGAWVTDYGYYGLGLYEVGDTLEVTFTGKNIPNLALFTDIPSGQAVGGGTGLFVQTSSNGYNWSERLSITSPNRIETGVISDYTNYDKYDLGKTQDSWYQDTTAKNVEDKPASLFGYLMLEDGVDYLYRIKSETTNIPTTSKQLVLKLTLELYKKVGDTYELVKDLVVEKLHKLPSLNGTYAIAYSAGSYVNANVSFKYNIITSRRSADVYRNSDSLEITMNGLENGNASYYAVGYHSEKDTFVSVFKGKNVPDVCLFADVMNGNQTAGEGVYLSIGESGTSIYSANRKSGSPIWTGADQNDISYAELNDDKQYAIKVSQTYDGGKLTFVIDLLEYDQTTELYNKIKTITSDAIAFDLNVYKGRNAILFGKDAPISFSAEIVTFVKEDTIVLKHGGEVHKPTSTLETSTNWNYVATKGVTEDEIVKVYFDGKNVPNVVMLADSNQGQAYGGGKGYAFIATQVYGSYGDLRFHASGPNRICMYTNYLFGRGTESIVGSNGNNKDKIAYGDYESSQSYVLSMYSYKTKNGIMLNYNVDTASGTAVRYISVEVKDDYAKSLYQQETDAYSYILYGNSLHDIEFTYEIKSSKIHLTQDNFATLMTATGGTFVLDEDIDMTTLNENWKPTGTFAGKLQGNGHKISNLKTTGLFNWFNGVIENVAFVNANYVGAQDGILADRIDGGTVKDVVIKTVENANSNLGGVLCRQLNGTVTLNNVVIETSTIRTDNTYGFISGFASTTSKVNCTDCYFITDARTIASGVRSGSYYNDIWSENATNHLATSASDTQYSNFLKGSYTIYSNASVSDSETAFANDETVITSADLYALIQKVGIIPV